MRTILLPLLACLCMGSAQAQQALDDSELANVSGGDGINFSMHLSLNDPTLAGAVTDSRFTMGFNVEGRNTYIVLKNPRGTIDMFGLNLNVEKKPDGSDYVAIGLPQHTRYGDFGFESLSVQADPQGPVTESLGRFNLNGTVRMQGQLRLWAH